MRGESGTSRSDRVWCGGCGFVICTEGMKSFVEGGGGGGRGECMQRAGQDGTTLYHS
eukprot:COSAG05_NODE_22716_length_263_cov_0.524390_1_plen_56_part_01